MADRPKKKVQSGIRNDERKCGKAPKKHPKSNDVRKLTDEQRAERDRLAAERRVLAEKKRVKAAKAAAIRQKRFINSKHEEALVLNRQFDAARAAKVHLAGARSIHAMAAKVGISA